MLPGFVDLAADPFLIRKTFGLQLHSLSLPQFIDRVGGIAGAAVAADMRVTRGAGAAARARAEQQPEAAVF